MPRNVELEHNSAVPEHVHAITLVRHGRTAYNAQHRLQGHISFRLLQFPKACQPISVIVSGSIIFVILLLL